MSYCYILNCTGYNETNNVQLDNRYVNLIDKIDKVITHISSNPTNKFIDNEILVQLEDIKTTIISSEFKHKLNGDYSEVSLMLNIISDGITNSDNIDDTEGIVLARIENLQKKLRLYSGARVKRGSKSRLEDLGLD